nr:MAG TPA: hypothetical protein [Caudoviricetes sp.]
MLRGYDRDRSTQIMLSTSTHSCVGADINTNMKRGNLYGIH